MKRDWIIRLMEWFAEWEYRRQPDFYTQQRVLDKKGETYDRRCD